MQPVIRVVAVDAVSAIALVACGKAPATRPQQAYLSDLAEYLDENFSGYCPEKFIETIMMIGLLAPDSHNRLSPRKTDTITYADITRATVEAAQEVHDSDDPHAPELGGSD